MTTNQQFFLPWVGSSYSTGGVFGKRIMVLGESHYIEEEINDDYRRFTQDMVENYLSFADSEGWRNTLLKFERSLVGHYTEPQESRKIWQSLLFYNYLQVPMDGTRQAGSSQDYQEAVAPFFEVLEQYRPQYIIVWGQRLWGNMPAGERWSWNPDIVVDGQVNKCGNYALKDGTRVKIMPVYHPSVGFSWDYWHKVISKFFSL